MATFSIENFGCRATDADAAALRGQLIAGGWTPSPSHIYSDVVLLNTCTVTAAADTQAREAVRKIRRANPSARIVVTGCYAQRAPEELASLEGVAWVVGNAHQERIPEILGSGVSRPVQGSGGNFVPLSRLNCDALSLQHAPTKILTGDIFAQTSFPFAAVPPVECDRTRPILKIQDGCDNRCAYCVIPMVRGKSRSLPPDDVVATVRELVDAGSKEIVLSGINLGGYGRDLSPRVKLTELVCRVLSETSLDQLRFSSIEPQDVTAEFVQLVASTSRLAPHFHIPLQSGSDRILRAMHRWYRTAHYAERVRLIRRLLPYAAIGADVIAGFPGESEEDILATGDFIQRMPFTYLHVFSFSPRPGTKAEKLSGAVPPQTVRDRARFLRLLSQEKAGNFRGTAAGRVFRALTLRHRADTWTEALTANYLRVRIAGNLRANMWVDLRVPQTAEGIAEPIRVMPAGSPDRSAGLHEIPAYS